MTIDKVGQELIAHLEARAEAAERERDELREAAQEIAAALSVGDLSLNEAAKALRAALTDDDVACLAELAR